MEAVEPVQQEVVQEVKQEQHETQELKTHQEKEESLPEVQPEAPAEVVVESKTENSQMNQSSSQDQNNDGPVEPEQASEGQLLEASSESPKVQAEEPKQEEVEEKEEKSPAKKQIVARDEEEKKEESKAEVKEEVAEDGAVKPKKKRNRKKKTNVEQHDDSQQQQKSGEEAKGEAAARNDQKPRGKNNKQKEQQTKDGSKAKQQPAERKKKEAPTQHQPFVAKRKFDSKYQEYMFGEWRRYRARTYVTAETKIPEMPKKRVSEPDDVPYHMKQVETDEQIDELNAEFKELIRDTELQRQELRQGQTGRGDITKQLNTEFDEIKVWGDKKRIILAAIEKVNREITDLDKARQNLYRQVHPVYNSLDTLSKGVKELERRMSTTTMDRASENRILGEIEKVKASRPTLTQIDKLSDEISALRDKKKEIAEDLPEIKQVMDGVRKEINRWKSKDQVFVESKEGFQKQLDHMQSQKENIRNQISKLRKDKLEAKEAYYGQMIEFELQEMLIKDIEWITKTKTIVKEREERLARYAAEKAQRLEQRKKLIEQRKRKEEEWQAKKTKQDQDKE